MSTILTCNLTALIAVIFLRILRKTDCFSVFGIGVTVFILFLSIIRIAIPWEFPFTQTFFIKNVGASIMPFLYTPRSLWICTLSLWQLFLAIWITGILVKSMIFFASWNNLYSLHKRLSIFNESSLRIALDNLKTDSLKYNCQYYQIPPNTTPCCSGFLKYKIYLPADTYTSEEMYYILRHEYAHLNTYDLLLKSLVEFFCIVQWWNPLMYWIRSYIYQLLEIRADRNAISNFTPTQISNYASCLVKSAHMQLIKMHHTQVNIHWKKESTLILRCKILLKHTENSHSGKKKILSFFLILLSLSFCFLPLFVTINTTTDTYPEGAGFSLEIDDVYIIQTSDGFMVYSNGTPVGSITDIPQAFQSVPVYSSIQEVPK